MRALGAVRGYKRCGPSIRMRSHPTTRPSAAPSLGMPLDDHIALDDMDVRQFVMSPAAQAIITTMQLELLEAPYTAFGNQIDGAGERFNIVLPSTFGSDRRKPVTPAFQSFCETVFWPLMNALLFGPLVWPELRPHLTCFKVNTLRISEDEPYYGQPVYHFHLDHRIGPLAPKDQTQKRTMRMIFSVVPDATSRDANGDVHALPNAAFDSTIYLRQQPPGGFASNAGLHEYLTRRFPERGLASNRERPLYEVNDDELYRAVPGEVLVHHSHPGRPIHAETNPCPRGRGLYVLDWSDIAHVERDDASCADGADGGKGKRAACRVLPCTRTPLPAILGAMRVLQDGPGSAAFCARLAEVAETAQSLVHVVSEYADGAWDGGAALERVAAELRAYM